MWENLPCKQFQEQTQFPDLKQKRKEKDLIPKKGEEVDLLPSITSAWETQLESFPALGVRGDPILSALTGRYALGSAKREEKK